MEPIALPLALTAETIAPNAFELKQRYNGFLARGLAVAALVHLVGLGAFRIVESMQVPVAEDKPMEYITVLPPSPPLSETPPDTPRPPAPAVAPVGTPTPVADDRVDPAQTMPTQADMAPATPGPTRTGISALPADPDVAVRPFVPAVPPPVPPTPTPAPVVEDEVFVVVEQPPVLIGGIEGLQASIEYPSMARQVHAEGRVVVQFVVDETGTPTDIHVVRGVGSGLDEAAVSAVRRARFEPGMQRGRAVKVRFTLPITFRLAQ